MKLGRDYTLYATIDGVVKYERYTNDRTRVSVYPEGAVPAAPVKRAPKAKAAAPAAANS